MKYKLSLTIYTISHFVVDFSCFYILMGIFSESIKNLMTISVGFLIYNILAFGLQMFIGYFVDQNNVEHFKVAMIGCLLVVFGVMFGFSPWLALVFCAVGNASFHIGGGINSLMYSDGKIARGGVFVSSGALGVALGTVAGKSGFQFWVDVLLLLSCFALIYFFCSSKKYNSANTCKNKNISQTNISLSIKSQTNISKGKIIIYLCLISIIVRSFVGFQVPITWKTNTLLFILPSIGAFVGKFAGGFLADNFGAKKVGVLSLLLSIPFLGFFNNNILLCVVGLVAFNISMSITLWGVASQLPNQPGFAFGLTTLALLVGDVPVFFFKLPERLVVIVLPILIIISASSIFFSLKNQKRRGYNVKKIDHLPKKLPL